MGTTTSNPICQPWPECSKGSGTWYTRDQRSGLVGADYEALKQKEAIAMKAIHGNPKWKVGRKKRSINDQDE